MPFTSPATLEDVIQVIFSSTYCWKGRWCRPPKERHSAFDRLSWTTTSTHNFMIQLITVGLIQKWTSCSSLRQLWSFVFINVGYQFDSLSVEPQVVNVFLTYFGGTRALSPRHSTVLCIIFAIH